MHLLLSSWTQPQVGSSISILMRNGPRLNNLLSVKASWIWHNIHVSYNFEVTCFMPQFLCFTLKHLMTSYIIWSFFPSKVVTAVVIVKVCQLNIWSVWWSLKLCNKNSWWNCGQGHSNIFLPVRKCTFFFLPRCI